MLRKTQEIEANVEGAELLSFRVLWFVVAGFVIGFTTSTLWEWLYYRRKRLAMLAEHSEFVRDAGRQQSTASLNDEPATSDGTEWRTPFYRSPGVFLESEQPGADATFTGTAFTPSTAPWVAPPPAAPPPSDEAEGNGAIHPGRPYRAATGEEAAPTSGPHKIADGPLPYTPQSTRSFQPTTPRSALTRDELSPVDQVEEAEAAQLAAAPISATTVAPATRGPRATYANVIVVDQVTADVEPNDEASPAAASAGISDKPLSSNTDDNSAPKADEKAHEDAAITDFNVVELTAPTTAAVATPIVGSPQITKRNVVDAIQPADTGQNYAADLPTPTLVGEATERRAPERTSRERPDDYPDDLAMIKGIGEAYKRRLYATSIYTWRQVAENDLDSLRRITRAKPNADIQSWQTQARELAEKYQRWDAHFAGPLDDLTQIDGIGAITADMLYKAGICTYGALAQTSPDELARIVPAPTVGNENDFEGWIREGARLDGVKRKNQGLLA